MSDINIIVKDTGVNITGGDASVRSDRILAQQAAAAAAASSSAATSSAASANASSLAAASSADSAANQVALATTQAGTATTQAGIATTQAGIATTQAGIAATYAANAASGLIRQFSTTALGVSGTSNGEIFAVMHATNVGADVWMNSSGTATNMQQFTPVGQGIIYSNEEIDGRTISIVGSLPSTPVIDMNSVSGYLYNGRFTPNKGVTTSSRNMLARSSGVIAGTVTNGTATEFYAVGPAGLQTAKRLQLNATNGVYDFFKGVVVPAGPYTFKVKVKSNTGQGTANFNFGVLTGGGSMAASSSTEAGWTTLTTTVTPNGTSDQPRITIQNTGGTAIDILVDEAQWYFSSETIPSGLDAWPANNLLRSELGYVGSTGRDGPFIDTRTKTLIGFAPLPTWPLKKTFSAVTIMALLECNENTRIATKGVVFDGPSTTVGVGSQTGLFYAEPVLPRLSTNPAHYIEGTGWHVLSLRVQAGEQSAWLDKFKHTVGTTASPSIPSVSGLIVGSESLTSSLNWGGRMSQIAVFDTALSDAQMVTAYNHLVARHAINGGVAPSATKVWICEGDSITFNNSASPDGPNYQAQYMSTYKPAGILTQNNAVSGSNLTHLTTRLTSTFLTSRISTAVANGYNVVVAVLVGANGVPTIAQLETYWNALKTAGAKVAACTILPREDAPDGGVAFNAARNALNVQIRASSVPNAIIDFAANTNIGPDGAASAGVYYQADKVHPNAAGQAIMMGIAKPVIEAL